MYCPNCSAKNDKNQNYCRFCGLNIEETAKSLKLQLSFGKEAQTLKELNFLKQAINYIPTCLIALLVIGIMSLIYFDSFSKDTVKTLIKASVGIYFVFYLLQETLSYFLKKKINRTQPTGIERFSDEQKIFEPKETNKLLEEKVFTPASSVTENSTELLLTENRTRKLN